MHAFAFKGSSMAIKWAKETASVSKAFYYATSFLARQPTLGEEYTGVCLVQPSIASKYSPATVPVYTSIHLYTYG